MVAWLGRMVAATAMLGFAASASAQIVGIGSNPPGTLAYSSAAALAKAANDAAKLQVRVQPSAGPSIYMPQIDSGELETGIVTLLSIYEYTGRPGADAKKPHNLRLAIVLFPLRAGILVRRGSPIRSVADLRGKRVPGEFATQINSLWMAEATLASAGLTYADVQTVPVPHVVRGMDDFAAGRADAAFFSLAAAKVAEVNAQLGGVRFLSVENNARTAAAFAKHAPGSYVSQVVPSPALAGVPEPTNVLATDLTMIAGAKASDELIYKLVKSAYEKRAEMAEAFPPFREMTAMAKKAAFEFHPGAIKAYQEFGLWPPKD